VESGKAGPGRAEYFSIHEDRLFLFPNTKVKRMFDDNPDRYAHVGIGLGGYCPVCLHNGKKVMGKMEYRATYDGITYLFPSEKARQAFVAEPGKYTPVMNGDCTVCQKEMGKSVPGNVDYSLVHDGRLYVFPGEKQLEMFEKNPAKYADADRALDGYCPVCVGEMNKLVRGDAKFSAMHNGKQYLFPGEDQLRMFNANPAVYTGKTIDDRFEKLVKQKSQSRASSKDSGRHCTAGCCGCGG
jgi:YHS domain-containing protein